MSTSSKDDIKQTKTTPNPVYTEWNDVSDSSPISRACFIHHENHDQSFGLCYPDRNWPHIENSNYVKMNKDKIFLKLFLWIIHGQNLTPQIIRHFTMYGRLKGDNRYVQLCIFKHYDDLFKWLILQQLVLMNSLSLNNKEAQNISYFVT